LLVPLSLPKFVPSQLQWMTNFGSGGTSRMKALAAKATPRADGPVNGSGNQMSARSSVVRIALAAFLCCLAGTAALAQSAVDLELVLAVDVSGSVNQARFELQKQGYVAAFRDARVVHAIRSGANRAITVTMVQWTGPQLHVQVVPWTLVGNQTSAEAFSAAIDGAPRQLFGGGTSISGAIDYGLTLFDGSRYRGTRRVIDVSGDGSNNRGRPAAMARDDAVLSGVAINGLPILAIEPDLDRYYQDNVIGGPGAFTVAAETYEAFADAILKKLIAEIAALAVAPEFAILPLRRDNAAR